MKAYFLFVVLFFSGCAQINTESQYLTVQQFVKKSSIMYVPLNKVNPLKINDYINAISKKILLASISFYKKNKLNYSKVDYLCANQLQLFSESNPKGKYIKKSGYYCFGNMDSWLNIIWGDPYSVGGLLTLSSNRQH